MEHEPANPGRRTRTEVLSFLQMVFIIGLLGYLNYLIVKPFLSPLIWAGVFSILFYPLYFFLLKRIGRPTLSALIVVALIVLLVIGPVAYVAVLLVNEILALADAAGSGKLDLRHVIAENQVIQYLLGKVQALFGVSEQDLYRNIAGNFSKVGREVATRLTSGIGNALGVAVDFVFMVIASFFFLKDGPRIFTAFLARLSFPEEAKRQVVKQVKDIVVSTVYGGVVVALVQAALSGLAFFFVGASSPVLWGVVTFIASFIPALGAFVIWMPATAYFFIKGMVSKGLIMGGMGIVISTIDNVLRAVITGKRAQMSFFPLLISVLGGVQVFGLLGIVLGPVVLAIFLAMLRVSTENAPDRRESLSVQEKP